ncbi:MAG TPA: UDP-N-acetylglucosamine 2-epimerase, partial [Dehalococcoidia bacterium]|nr:UDP-N-acetylglucosamine 2-epimerase [Dehalococcoidia bacterium]
IACRALGEGVPIIQLHAGESTPNTFDDDVRHFISRVAALRLCCHEVHRQRLLAMGIPDATIHVTGAPGLDRLTRPHMARSVLARHLRLDPARRWALVLLHPTTRPPIHVDPEEEYRSCVEAIGDRQALWFTPCQDPGRERYTRDRQVDCVADAAWRGMLREAEVLIGNSSALVVEAPFVGLRTVEIGVRQQGRERVPYGDGQSVPRIVKLLQEWTP